MDPFKKGLKISTLIHIGAVGAVLIAVLWGQLFKPRPAAVFTVMAPPAGLIAGGSASTPRVAPSDALPSGPKLPSPTPSQVSKKPIESSAIPAPMDDFLAPPEKTKAKSETGWLKPQKTTPKKTTPKASTKPKQEKLSYAQWQKKYAPKSPAKATSKATAKPTKPKAAAAPAETAPSFEENLASRLDKRLQEEGTTTVGTGLGGPSGSGVAGNGIAGAINDADTIYAGTLYTYLNSVWTEPKEVGSVHLTAEVEFTVDKDGTITAWRIIRRSGADSFDRSVAAVFAKVKEVSPPPTVQEYRLTVTFETRDS